MGKDSCGLGKTAVHSAARPAVHHTTKGHHLAISAAALPYTKKTAVWGNFGPLMERDSSHIMLIHY